MSISGICVLLPFLPPAVPRSRYVIMMAPWRSRCQTLETSAAKHGSLGLGVGSGSSLLSLTRPVWRVAVYRLVCCTPHGVVMPWIRCRYAPPHMPATCMRGVETRIYCMSKKRRRFRQPLASGSASGSSRHSKSHPLSKRQPALP